uniref:Uncharacterized protein n=1 Tax=Arundo donax TaxID=35708 RepID=A0A0A9EL06_ARUDO
MHLWLWMCVLPLHIAVCRSVLHFH